MARTCLLIFDSYLYIPVRTELSIKAIVDSLLLWRSHSLKLPADLTVSSRRIGPSFETLLIHCDLLGFAFPVAYQQARTSSEQVTYPLNLLTLCHRKLGTRKCKEHRVGLIRSQITLIAVYLKFQSSFGILFLVSMHNITSCRSIV